MTFQKESAAIIASVVVLAFAVSLMSSITYFLYCLLAIFAVLFINVIAKKITAYYLDSKIKIKLWEVQKYGFKPKYRLPKPFPMGLFLAVLSSALSLGYVVWFAPLSFEVTSEVYRSSKRHGLYSFSEMTEFHIGLIAAAGIAANLLFVVVGYLTGWTLFTGLNIAFAFFNMIPISNLDGNKIFFGSTILWSFLAALTLIATAYGIFII